MRSLCKVSLRIMAIWIFIQSLIYFQSLLFSLGTISQMDLSSKIFPLLYYIFSFIVMVAIGTLLWIYSDKLTNRIVEEDPLPQLHIKYDSLQTAAFVIIGVTIIFIAIPRLIGDVYNYVSLNNLLHGIRGNNSFDDALKVKISIITNVLRIVGGVFLVFGSNGIVSFIRKLGDWRA